MYMMKNIVRRALSVLIVLTLVFTTFMVFDPADVFHLGMKANAVTWMNTWEGAGSLFSNNITAWGSDSGGSYRDFASFAVSRTFYNGEFYELEYDAKGSGTLINYFYGESGYKNCSRADVSSSDGRYSEYKAVGGDGDTRFTLTSDWVHYRVDFRKYFGHRDLEG